jgi:uncharacterized protein YndB with AHSA1/START domain
MVRATLLLPGCPPERALAAFTDPATLRQWWGGELTCTPAEGGPYVVHFATLGQTMRGRVVGYEPGSRLEFTWGWDHEPGAAGRTVLVTVTVTVAGADGGTDRAARPARGRRGGTGRAQRSPRGLGVLPGQARPAPGAGLAGVTGQRDSAPAGRDRSFAPPMSAF